MTTDSTPATAETNVFGLIWNRRLLVLAFALAFAGIGLLLSELRQKEYTAEASVLLTQPAPAEGDPLRDEARYVADQVAVMKSLPIAISASQIAAKDPKHPIKLDPRAFQGRTLISATEDSNFVAVSFRANDPNAAITGANATVKAYDEATTAELTKAKTDAETRIKEAITSAQTPDSGTTPEDAAALVSRLKAELARVETEAAVGGEDVVAPYPADTAKSDGLPTFAVLAFSFVLGAFVGAGVAYWRGMRSQEFFDALEPEALVGAPLLAEIPEVGRGGAESMLPTLISPGTSAAREFRFLASTLAHNTEPSRRASGKSETARRPGSVAFMSPSQEDGSTIVAANTALAAAQQGHKVQAVDADTESQGLRSLLAGATAAADEASLETNGHRKNAGGELGQLNPPRVIQVDGRGTVTLADLSSDSASATNRRAQSEFDLIIADTPPMLDGDHMDEVLRMAGSVVVVLSHRGKVALARQLIKRLDLLGVRPLGYVYNRGGVTRKQRSSPRPVSAVASQGTSEPRPADEANFEDLAQQR